MVNWAFYNQRNNHKYCQHCSNWPCRRQSQRTHFFTILSHFFWILCHYYSKLPHPSLFKSDPRKGKFYICIFLVDLKIKKKNTHSFKLLQKAKSNEWSDEKSDFFFFRGKRQKFPSEDGETVILFFNRMLAPERSWERIDWEASSKNAQKRWRLPQGNELN